ncbi:MAG TPA: hypothetical protein VF342_13225 [Alphaproteobacteria bacterium]
MTARTAWALVGGLVGLVVAGCQSAEELRTADATRCTAYGFEQGSNEFAGCLQRESLARRYGYDARAWPPYPPGYGWGRMWW